MLASDHNDIIVHMTQEEDVGGGLEGAAARAVRASLTSLQQDAAKAGLDPTGEAGSWQGVLDALQTACDMLAQASTSAVDEEASPRAGSNCYLWCGS